MASQAQLESNKRHHEKLDDIKIRVPKGDREIYKAFAESRGQSLNALVVALLNSAMEADGQPPPRRNP